MDYFSHGNLCRRVTNCSDGRREIAFAISLRPVAYAPEWRMIMPNILPVSDLRNYNEVLKNCQVGEPVFLTKNGRGRFVVLDIEDYERDRAEKKLLKKLHEAEEAVKVGEGWLSLEELKAALGE